MEFLVIGQSKLKVILTKKESEKYNIKATDGDYAGAEVRRTLRSILGEAKAKVGFDIGTDKVLIQLYPTSDGGFELFATKLGMLTERERRAVSASDNLTTFSGARGIYRFKSLEDLTSAARAIWREGIVCDVYLSDDGEYYISITEHILNGFSEFEVLTEYGKRIPSLPSALFREHTRLICEGEGINIFSKL